MASKTLYAKIPAELKDYLDQYAAENDCSIAEAAYWHIQAARDAGGVEPPRPKLRAVN